MVQCVHLCRLSSSLSLHAHNCLSFWTTETTNFELATRIPMFVVAPPSLGGNFAKGVVVPAVVESVDLMVTLADLVRLSCLIWIMSVCLMSGFVAVKTRSIAEKMTCRHASSR